MARRTDTDALAPAARDRWLEQHSAAHAATTAGRCGGAVDEECTEDAAWRLTRPWGGHTLHGYCSVHAARMARADEQLAEMETQSRQSRIRRGT